MIFFKKYTYEWWQIGIFKLALLAIGIMIGAHWYEFWNGYVTTLIVVAAIASVYIAYVSLKQ